MVAHTITEALKPDATLNVATPFRSVHESSDKYDFVEVAEDEVPQHVVAKVESM